MPLEVLIASPSGPLGELIRLTLEAEPAFHCALIDKGDELTTAIRKNSVQAVIYDCSFSQSDPEEVSRTIRTEYPTLALLFIPTDSNPDKVEALNNLADGIITRPFDAALLPDLIKSAVQKRTDILSEIEPSTSNFTKKTRLNTFQEAIGETTASSGLIITDGKLETVTAEINSSLQEQVVSAISQYWNPADTSDLMRYIKDPETNQDWMMYASQIANARVLALLFLKQTPISLVRIQTVQLARQLAKNELFFLPVYQPDEDVLDFQEPPSLQNIISQTKDEQSRNPSSSFPVEWFKEIDIPDSSKDLGSNEEVILEPGNSTNPLEPENVDEQVPNLNKQPSEQKIISKDVIVDAFDFVEFEPLTRNEVVDEPVELTTSWVENAEQPITDIEIPETEKKTHVNLSETSPVNIDLGSFQPVDLIPNSPEDAGLDSFQPVTLNSTRLPDNLDENLESEEFEAIEPLPITIISEIADMPDPEMDFEDHQPESPEQIVDDNIPINENLSFFEPEETENTEEQTLPPDETVPDNLIDIPELENLPYFLSKPVKETPVFDYDIFKIDEDESGLPDSGSFDTQSDGELAMESDHSEEEQFNNQFEHSGELRDNPENFEEPSSGTKSDLFARMNKLQTADKNEGTETVTVALIPWQESFILTRLVAGVLNQQMNRLSQAFNWKLENLTIRPTYMQFTVTIPSLFSPEDMVGIVRKQTSLVLNENLPDLHLPADLDDIWASESMMATGIEFVPSNHWQNFINRRNNSEIA